MAEQPHAPADMNVRHVLLAGLAILIAIVLAVAVSWIFIAVQGGTKLNAHAPPPNLQPQLESHPIPDLAAFRAQEAAKLSRYGWVDRQAGIVQVPVDRAMDILVARASREQNSPATAGAAKP